MTPVVVPSKPAFAKYKLILTNCYQEEHFKRFPLLLYPHVKLLRSPTVAPTLSGTTRWCFYRSYSFSEQIVFEKKKRFKRLSLYIPMWSLVPLLAPYYLWGPWFEHNIGKSACRGTYTCKQENPTRMIIQHTVKVVVYEWEKFVKLVTLLS